MTTFNPRFRTPPGTAPGTVPTPQNPGTPQASVDELLQLLGADPGVMRWYLDPTNAATDTFLKNASVGVGDPALLRSLGLDLPGNIQEILRTREELRSGTTRAFLDPTGYLRMRRQGAADWYDPVGEGWKQVVGGSGYDPVAGHRGAQTARGTGSSFLDTPVDMPTWANPFPGGASGAQRAFAPMTPSQHLQDGQAVKYQGTTWGPDGRPITTDYVGRQGPRGVAMTGTRAPQATGVGSRPQGGPFPGFGGGRQSSFPGFVNPQSRARYGS